jgi:hypothetical protein
MNKYGAERVERDGIMFDSRAEAGRYRELKLLLEAGVIQDLDVHPRYLLFEKKILGNVVVSAIHYTADFEYSEDGKRIVEDVKGIVTRDAALRINLFRRLYPDKELRIIYNKERRYRRYHGRLLD